MRVAGADQVVLKDGVLEPVTDNDVDLGSSTKEFKNAFFDGTVKTDTLTVDSGGATITNGGLTVTAAVVLPLRGRRCYHYCGWIDRVC